MHISFFVLKNAILQNDIDQYLPNPLSMYEERFMCCGANGAQRYRCQRVFIVAVWHTQTFR